MAQELPTATPDADGVIYAMVQPNDSLWAISARVGISLAELLALNNLTETSIIQPGQQLIIGYGTPPPTATIILPTATPTATRMPPTPTFTPLPPPRTAICLKAFSDVDRDGIHDPGEAFKVGVAFTVYNEAVVIGNYITTGVSEPHCFEGLPPGDYKVTRSVGRSETLTTAGNWTLTLARGSVLNIEFGSFLKTDPTPSPNSEPVVGAEGIGLTPEATAAPVSSDSTLVGKLDWLDVGLISILVLLFGSGLLLIARLRRPPSSG